MIKRFQKMKNRHDHNDKDENMLSNNEIDRLILLGDRIKQDLSCNLNGTGFPCRSDRMSAINCMEEYLEINER